MLVWVYALAIVSTNISVPYIPSIDEVHMVLRQGDDATIGLDQSSYTLHFPCSDGTVDSLDSDDFNIASLSLEGAKRDVYWRPLSLTSDSGLEIPVENKIYKIQFSTRASGETVCSVQMERIEIGGFDLVEILNEFDPGELKSETLDENQKPAGAVHFNITIRQSLGVLIGNGLNTSSTSQNGNNSGWVRADGEAGLSAGGGCGSIHSNSSSLVLWTILFSFLALCFYTRKFNLNNRRAGK